eukprot:CAMPEP_0180801370 /NCGR_PEP_ID=MMETSP1038_2-20121128/59619_1 /TAXON_ID=632150 /ORGANISM="Azadinium spinosum, Strain 3D9" /LENGTH=121 /DNA_ID=CAMNT_0022841197 /DNA_START=12 /DNA_END=373 /DNA_ORIENTATION=+
MFLQLSPVIGKPRNRGAVLSGAPSRKGVNGTQLEGAHKRCSLVASVATLMSTCRQVLRPKRRRVQQWVRARRGELVVCGSARANCNTGTPLQFWLDLRGQAGLDADAADTMATKDAVIRFA